MIVSTQGVVISSIKYRETSLIVKIFTASHGLVSFIVNGVRSSKAKNKAALFQPLTILDVEMYYKEGKNLQRLKEYKNGFIYTSIPFDIVKSSISMFLLEVLGHCIHEDECNEELYDFLHSSLQYLDKKEKVSPDFHLSFLCQLMYHLGIAPHGRFSSVSPFFDMREGTFKSNQAFHDLYLTGENAQYFSALIHQENYSTSKRLRSTVLKEILRYYQLHFDGFRKIKSLSVLEMVLN